VGRGIVASGFLERPHSIEGCEHNSSGDRERGAMETVLERIESAAAAVADELGADLRTERDDRGKLPLVGFRLHGFVPAKDSPVETDRDMRHP
jgi:hypothetical protein